MMRRYIANVEVRGYYNGMDEEPEVVLHQRFDLGEYEQMDETSAHEMVMMNLDLASIEDAFTVPLDISVYYEEAKPFGSQRHTFKVDNGEALREGEEDIDPADYGTGRDYPLCFGEYGD